MVKLLWIPAVWITLQLPDLLGPQAVVPPLRVQGALKKQKLLFQLGLLSVHRTAPLLQLAVQALQLAHRLGHLSVALPQSRCCVRLCAQEVVGLFQLSIESEDQYGMLGLMYCPPLHSDRVCVCLDGIPDSGAG